MNPQNKRELEQRLRNLEAELERSVNSSHQRLVESGQPASNTVLNWFNGLSKGGKVVVITITVVATLTIVSAVLQLLALSIRLAVLAGFLYLVYKLFFASRNSNQ